MTLSVLAALITELTIVAGIVIAFTVWLSRLIEGQRCQLRTAMLNTYYACKDTKKIHQYEIENFHKNYNAYKALKGNSFIDDIYKEVRQWEVIM